MFCSTGDKNKVLCKVQCRIQFIPHSERIICFDVCYLFSLPLSFPLSLFPLLCMCPSWLSFFREMPVYSFVNMTDIMSFLIHHQAQIKTLFWVYTSKSIFLPPSFLNLTLALFTLFSFFLSFFVLSLFFLVQLCEEIITLPSTLDHLVQLFLSSIHTHRDSHILWLMANFTWMTFFFIYCLCLWFISKDICHPECIDRRTVCEHMHTTVYVRVAWFCFEGWHLFIYFFYSKYYFPLSPSWI